MKHTFIGDAGLDHYLADNTQLLGGCSLNVATHFKRNTQEEATLLFPTTSDNPIEAHCHHEGIQVIPLYRRGTLPCQEIDQFPNGEKKILHYHSGVIEKFNLKEEEKHLLGQMSGTVVMPLYTQIKPFIDQVLKYLPTKETLIIIDFHSAEDFNKDFDRLLPYLTKCHMAQFGLGINKEDLKLKDQLIQFSKDKPLELLITQGKGELLFKTKEQTHRHAPVPIDSVVDSTGAGDAFLGAFLAMRQRMPLEQAIAGASLYTHPILNQRGTL